MSAKDIAERLKQSILRNGEDLPEEYVKGYLAALDRLIERL